MPLRHRLAAVVLGAALAALAGCQSSQPKTASPPPPEPQLPPPKPVEVSPPERSKIHSELAAGYYERGQMDVALDELAEATKLDPSNARAYNVYGLVYSMIGESAKAEQSFQRALALAPQDSEIRHNWGAYLCSHGRPQAAIPEFEQAIANPLYKTPEIALVNAGKCSFASGDITGADKYYRRALAAAPGNPTASYGLAFIAYKGRRYDEARDWLRPAVVQANPTPEALYLGLCVERRLGDRQAEMSYSSQLRNRYPDSAEARAINSGVCE
jgi:type IV pilus assembly protein PilF